MWYTYILLCDQKTFYVGITNNLQERISQHKSKKSFYTKRFSDLRLVYCEKYNRRQGAENRETQLKKWSFAKKLALIKQNIDLLKKFSKGPESVERLER